MDGGYTYVQLKYEGFKKFEENGGSDGAHVDDINNINGDGRPPLVKVETFCYKSSLILKFEIYINNVEH